MENYSYSSYPDSRDSSPRSRDNDSLWDEQSQQSQSSYKVKFMCSYGGKIHPRPHDNQLAYVGGETKILAVDRNVRFPSIVSKLSSLCENDVCFKYQLPGEDLDALISVTNDEDLEHMLLEYDRLYRTAGSKPARLRLFLFPLNSSNQSSFSNDDQKPSQQWFVDALNSVPTQPIDSSSPPSTVSNPPADFLFGFEKQQQVSSSPVAPPIAKLTDPIPEAKVVLGGLDPVRDDRNIGGDSVFEIQRQIQELQRLQISNQEQQEVLYQKKNEANLNLPRAFQGDYFMPEKLAPATVPVPVSIPPKMAVHPATPYWNAVTTGGYSDQVAGTGQQQQQQQQQQQPVYLIQSPAGMYQTPVTTNVRQVTGQTGQGYYGMQRMVPEVYREQPVYNMAPQPTQQQLHPQTGGLGYSTTQVAYDNTGRQVYYTTTAPPSGVAVPSSYPTAVASVSVDPRQSGALNQEGKIVKPPQVI